MKNRLCLGLVLASLFMTVQAEEPTAPPVRPDVSKALVELPARRLVVGSAPQTRDFVNPKVAPGKITWHPTWEAALAASARSGKPVLLFQLLGKLDQEFC